MTKHKTHKRKTYKKRTLKKRSKTLRKNKSVILTKKSNKIIKYDIFPSLQNNYNGQQVFGLKKYLNK